MWLALGFVALLIALLLAHPAFAQAASAAPLPSNAPAVNPSGGLDRAMKTIGGTGQPMSLSLQILLLMSLLTVLPSPSFTVALNVPFEESSTSTAFTPS